MSADFLFQVLSFFSPGCAILVQHCSAYLRPSFFAVSPWIVRSPPPLSLSLLSRRPSPSICGYSLFADWRHERRARFLEWWGSRLTGSNCIATESEAEIMIHLTRIAGGPLAHFENRAILAYTCRRAALLCARGAVRNNVPSSPACMRARAQSFTKSDAAPAQLRSEPP